MSFFDLVALILDNLGRRKARVGLTAVGVIIGTAAVVVLVSLGIGLQKNATEQLYGIGDLTQIQVMPNYEFIEGDIKGGPGGPGGPGVPGGETTVKLITDDSLDELAAIPGVVAVVPRDYLYGSGMMKYARLESYGNIIGVDVTDLGALGLEAAQGSVELARGTAVIGSQVPMTFYNPNWRPGQPEVTPPDLVGQNVTMIVIKWDENGNEIRKRYPLRIVGLLTETRGESDWSVYLNLADVNVYNEWINGRRINRNKDGYNQVIVKVGDVKDVLNITEQIVSMGYQAYTPQSFVEGITGFFIILQVIFGGVGAISLLVAAIGIANTMAMAILERTREIGLMKAVGATNRDVLSIFLGEAAGIGFVGGLGGVLLGLGAGQIINVLALAYLAQQAASQGGAPPTSAIETPLWLPLFTLAFSTLIGLLSGLYPALRAATMIPVSALKYE